MRVMPVVREIQLFEPGCSRLFQMVAPERQSCRLCLWRRVVGSDSNIWFWIGTHGKDDRRVGINEKQDGTFRTKGMMSTCDGQGILHLSSLTLAIPCDKVMHCNRR